MPATPLVASSFGKEIKWGRREVVLSYIKSLRIDQHLVIDFDQTLFSKNSSQEFMRMAKPYLFGAILYKALEVLKPWNWFGNPGDRELTRDWFHVWAVTIFFPWTWLVWRMKARKMAETWTNRELVDALKDREAYFNVLSSQGFGPIVRPLLKHMGVHFGRVDTCRLLFGHADRRRGKINRVRKMIGKSALRHCAVVTDSKDDRDLLEYVEVPLLLEQPPSPIRSVTSHYVPFYYMSKVKLMNFGRIFREVVYVDVLLLYFVFSWLSPFPLVHAVAMSFLFMSFLLIYEIGYMENDEVAFTLEKDPIYGHAFEEKRDAINYVEPWFWASAFALFGVTILQQVDVLQELGMGTLSMFSNAGVVLDSFLQVFLSRTVILMAGLWMLILTSMRYVYKFYNYTDKMTRTWVYPVLQTYKTFAFMFFSPTNLIGALALISQVVGRSFAYFLYRWGRKDWPGSELYLARFLLFATSVLILIPAIGRNYSELLTFQMLVITLWISSRAIKPSYRFVRNRTHISKDQWRKIEN